jgi:hypothetical protein
MDWRLEHHAGGRLVARATPLRWCTEVITWGSNTPISTAAMHSGELLHSSRSNAGSAYRRLLAAPPRRR